MSAADADIDWLSASDDERLVDAGRLAGAPVAETRPTRSKWRSPDRPPSWLQALSKARRDAAA